MEPRTFMGQPLGGPEIADRGELPRGYFKALGDEFSFNAYMTAERWRMLDEGPEDGLLQEEWEAQVGERDMPYEPGTGRSELERRIAFHDYEQHASKYEGHISASLLGGLPLMFDPANIATLPLGGPVGGVAKAAAGGWGQFLARYALGGATAGLAAVPLEIGFQRRETGRLRPMEIAGTVAGPAVLAPALAGAGRALRRVFRGGGSDGRQASRMVRNPVTPKDLDPEQGFRIVQQAKTDGVPPPPIHPRMAKPAPPQKRLQALFGNYDGGHRVWLRDYASGSMKAVRHIESLGYDRNDPMLQRLVEFVGRQSDQRSRTPVEYNSKVMQAFDEFRNRDTAPVSQESLDVLSENGLIERVQGSTDPKVARTPVAEDRWVYTGVGSRLKAAADDPTTPAHAKLLKSFGSDGPSAVRRAMDVDEDAPVVAGPRIIDDEWDDFDLITALTHMRRRADLPEAPRPSRPKADTEDGRIEGRTDVDDDMDAWARGVGAADSVQRIDEAVIDGARRSRLCGTG